MKDSKDILLGLDKETLVDMVTQLANNVATEDVLPEGYNLESGFKDALYSGMVDVDMEMSAVVPEVCNVTTDDFNIYVDGDLVSIHPQYRSLVLKIGEWVLTGIVKAEVVGTMIKNFDSLKVGEYRGWTKYFIQYKSHTLVAGFKGTACSLKLLKYDYMAQQMYQKAYKQPYFSRWRDDMESEKIFGPMDISLPNAVDDLLEQCMVALETLESGFRYEEIRNMVTQMGWKYEV